MLSIIVATDLNNAIGYNNNLLWHISEDLKYFKSVTQGHPVIMGRKTYESIGRPLPKRENIVLTRGDIPTPAIKEGSGTSFRVEHSVDEVIRIAKDSKDEYFVMGGGEIYNQAFPHADRLYITRIKAEAAQADTYFPAILPDKWEITSRSGDLHDAESDLFFEFLVYKRG